MITDFLTVPAAAKQLDKPEMTLYRWIKANKLFTIKVGGILFVPHSEIGRLKTILEKEKNDRGKTA